MKLRDRLVGVTNQARKEILEGDDFAKLMDGIIDSCLKAARRGVSHEYFDFRCKQKWVIEHIICKLNEQGLCVTHVHDQPGGHISGNINVSWGD